MLHLLYRWLDKVCYAALLFDFTSTVKLHLCCIILELHCYAASMWKLVIFKMDFVALFKSSFHWQTNIHNFLQTSSTHFHLIYFFLISSLIYLICLPILQLTVIIFFFLFNICGILTILLLIASWWIKNKFTIIYKNK